MRAFILLGRNFLLTIFEEVKYDAEMLAPERSLFFEEDRNPALSVP